MKKLLLILLFIASALTITSCKKDKVTDSNQATIAKLQGRWEATKYYIKQYEVENNNKLVTDKTANYPANDRGVAYNGTEISFISKGAIGATYTYAIVGNELRIREDNYGIYYKLNLYSDTEHSLMEESYYTNTKKVKIKEVRETYYAKK